MEVFTDWNRHVWTHAENDASSPARRATCLNSVDTSWRLSTTLERRATKFETLYFDPAAIGLMSHPQLDRGLYGGARRGRHD